VVGVIRARTELATTGTEHIKGIGRGYRNAAHYRARILLDSAQRAAGSPSSPQVTLLKCEGPAWLR
jgi:hypothetical protein